MDVRVRGATGMYEQRGVIGLDGGLAVDSKRVGEPHRDHGGLQTVLERKAHPQVGREAERAADALGPRQVDVDKVLGERSVDVATDGEVTAMTPPLYYRCRPRALLVIVPRAKGA
jgi:hypothetical protein